MASRLRSEDRREIEHATGKASHEVLPLAVSLSAESYTFNMQGPFCLFGVTDDPKNAGYGVVWLVASDEVIRHARYLVKQAPLYLDRWASRYPNGLHNYVDSRNLLHLRWLELVGFTLGEEIDIRGVPFLYFSRHKE